MVREKLDGLINAGIWIYEKILNYCYEKGAWMASGEEIWKWWNKYLR